MKTWKVAILGESGNSIESIAHWHYHLNEKNFIEVVEKKEILGKMEQYCLKRTESFHDESKMSDYEHGQHQAYANMYSYITEVLSQGNDNEDSTKEKAYKKGSCST